MPERNSEDNRNSSELQKSEENIRKTSITAGKIQKTAVIAQRTVGQILRTAGIAQRTADKIQRTTGIAQMSAEGNSKDIRNSLEDSRTIQRTAGIAQMTAEQFKGQLD